MANESKVYLQRAFECDIETLYSWLTEPERIAQWFGPEGFTTGKVKCELVEGGSYSIELKREPGLTFTVYGEYLEIKQPDLIKFSYLYDGLEGRPPSTVQFSLVARGAHETELTMVQEFEVATPDFSTRTKAWNFMMDRLQKLTS